MINGTILLLRRFARDERGVSAIEMGLIAPVLAMFVVGVIELGHVGYQRTDMHTSLRAGSQYVLNGGRDLDVAREIVERSWSSKPEDGEVEATKFCLCGTTEHVCNAPCNDNSVPEAYIALRATATLGGIAVDYGQTYEDAVRVR